MNIDKSLLTEQNISNITILDVSSVYCITKHVPKTYLEEAGWMAYDNYSNNFATVKHNHYFDITPVLDNQECLIRPVIEFWKPIDNKYCGQKISILGKEWMLTENKSGEVVALCSEVVGKAQPTELLMFLAEWYKDTKMKMYLEQKDENTLIDEVLSENSSIKNTDILHLSFNDDKDVAI